MPNSGKDYELFVKEVYEALNSFDGLEEVNIQHNIRLKGRARKHQIDIYWEFKKAGIPFRVVVECKDNKRPVEATKIEAFRATLDDLSNPIGIFASKHGFQEGAISVGKMYGIHLMDIHGPDDEDWNGRVRYMHFNLDSFSPTNFRVKIEIDKGWCEENNVDEHCFQEGYMDSDVFVLEGDNRQSLSEISKQILRKTEGRDFTESFLYKNAYLEVSGKLYKLNKLIFTYDIIRNRQTTTYDFGRKIKAFVKDVIEEETRIIDVHGGIIKRGE